MKYFVGIDSSYTGCGIVVIDESSNIIVEKLISTFKNKDNLQDIEKRIVDITNEISTILLPLKKKVQTVCIENISYSSKGQRICEMAALNYYVRIFLYLNDFIFLPIPPTSLKKFVTGTGKCQKDLMLLKCYKKFNVEFSDNNICDAYCLARFALDRG